jgi:hypothetical protein
MIMKLAGKVGKSAILVLAGAFLIWFWPELSSLPATGGLFDKLLLIAPVMVAIRISLIIVAFGIVGLVVITFWKQIGIIKIGSSGIEFGKLDEISSKTEAELAAKDATIKELEAKNELLRRQKSELKKRLENTNPDKKGVQS